MDVTVASLNANDKRSLIIKYSMITIVIKLEDAFLAKQNLDTKLTKHSASNVSNEVQHQFPSREIKKIKHQSPSPSREIKKI